MPTQDPQGVKRRSRTRLFAALKACAGALSVAFVLVFSPTPALPAATPAIPAPTPAQAARPVVTIGLVDTFTPNFYMYSYVPLIEWLREKLPQYEIRTRELPRGASLEKESFPPDTFLVLSSGDAVHYPFLGLEQLATRRRSGSPRADQSVGALFVVRADSPWKTLADLKDRSVATTSADAFEGWLIPMNEVAKEGFDPDAFFGPTLFTEWNVPDAMTMVLSGQTDWAILETCALEEALRTGVVSEGELRVVHELPNDDPAACRRSTERFPDVMVASLPSADPEVVRDVTVAVLTRPVDREGFDWVSNNNRTNVLALMERLKLGPYASLRDTSPAALLARYRVEVGGALALLALLLVHVVRVNLLVRRRTRELTEESEKREAAAEALRQSRQRLANLERAGTVAQLSALFAHEVKQPITAIVNYLTGIRMLRAQGENAPEREEKALGLALEAAYRAADIVERVRRTAKHEAPEMRPVDLREVVDEALRHAGLQKHPEVECRAETSTETTKDGGKEAGTETEPAPIMVSGDPLELQLVVVNLVKNALEALTAAGTPMPRIVVRLERRAEHAAFTCHADHADHADHPDHPAQPAQPAHAVVSVEDNGPALSDAAFAALGTRTTSTKPEGLGLGLAIALSIVEAHRGHLEFERLTPSGLGVRVVLPLLESDGTDRNARTTETTQSTETTQTVPATPIRGTPSAAPSDPPDPAAPTETATLQQPTNPPTARVPGATGTAKDLEP